MDKVALVVFALRGKDAEENASALMDYFDTIDGFASIASNINCGFGVVDMDQRLIILDGDVDEPISLGDYCDSDDDIEGAYGG